MKQIMLKLIIYLAVTLGLVFLYVKYLEAKSVFFPSKGLQASPADIGLTFQDIYLNTKDSVQIHGWFIPGQEAKYTLLFCHGNGGNLSDRLDKILILRQAKVNIFIIDYRGYGLSSGKPKELGIYLDAKAGYDYLISKKNIKPDQIILYGESLGAAVIIDLASREKVGGLIAEGAFSSGRDIGKVLYPYVPKFILPNIFDSLGKINKVKVPKLFLHSAGDEVVPIKLGKKLYQAAPEPKYFLEVSGGHNSIYFDSKDKYLVSIIAFLDKL